MSTETHIYLEINPIPKARARITRSGHAYTPKKTADYEALLRILLKAAYKKLPMNRPIELEVRFELVRPKSVKRKHPSVKPDLDNYLKALLDAGNKILWEDDGLICEVLVTKAYAAHKPGIWVKMNPYGPALGTDECFEGD